MLEGPRELTELNFLNLSLALKVEKLEVQKGEMIS